MKRSELARSAKPMRRAAPKKAERVCKTCGETFMFALSQLAKYKGGGQFCSRPCMYAGLKERAEKEPSRDKYGRKSTYAMKQWKQAVRERDDFTCRRCGKYDRYIHAHHVASRARRPDLKYDVDNGVCLDGTCHQWVHNNPIEAEALGFLSDAKYELERLGQRRQHMVEAKRSKYDEAEVIRLHREGARATEIGRQLGVTKGPILRILKENGETPHPCGNPNRRPS